MTSGHLLGKSCHLGFLDAIFIVCVPFPFCVLGRMGKPVSDHALPFHCNYSKIGIVEFDHTIVHLKQTEGMANCVDSYQTAPGAF